LPAPSSPPRQTLRRTLVAVALITFVLAAYGFTQVGHFLTKEDPLQKADAIAVLAGTSMDRSLGTADLYNEDYALRIVLTHGMPEASYEALAARGVTRSRRGRRIALPLRIHDNTAQEAQTLRELAVKNRCRRIIVVISKYHLRRAGFAIRREMNGTGVDIETRGTRDEEAHPDRWWTIRGISDRA
jgi:uncharacterized SAM-binding protein YcdF (DUF218 family)